MKKEDKWIMLLIGALFLIILMRIYPNAFKLGQTLFQYPGFSIVGLRSQGACIEACCPGDVDFCTAVVYKPEEKSCTKNLAAYGQKFDAGKCFKADPWYCERGYYICMAKWKRVEKTCTDWEEVRTCSHRVDGWYFITKEVRRCDGEYEIRNLKQVKCKADETCESAVGCTVGYCVHEGKKYKIGEIWDCHCVQARPGKIECYYCSDTLTVRPKYIDCPGKEYYCRDGKCIRIKVAGCGNGICEKELGENHLNCYSDCHMYDGICMWTSPGDGTPGTIADYENCVTDPQECKCPPEAPICLPSGDCGRKVEEKCKHEGEKCGGYGGLWGYCCKTENLICKEEGVLTIPLIGELFKTTPGICQKKTAIDKIFDIIPPEVAVSLVVSSMGVLVTYFIAYGLTKNKAISAGIGLLAGLLAFWLTYSWTTMPGWQRLLVGTFGGIGMFLFGGTIISILLTVASLFVHRR